MSEELLGFGLVFVFVVMAFLVTFGFFGIYLRHQRRHPSVVKKINSEKFEKNPYETFVGVEIECLRHSDQISSLNNFNFKSGRDSSIEGKGVGVEYRSSPSQGDKIIEMIDEFCKKLNDTKHSVNKTCGLHIHLETPLDLDLIKKMYCFYSKYENLFFDMLPASRHDSQYCEKFEDLDKYSWKKVLETKDINDFKRLFYGRLIKYPEYAHKKRYCWINFHSIFYRGTTEIRAHSGTINARKIRNWIMIHLIIRDFLNKNSLTKIEAINPTKNNFLKLFPKDLQSYIKERWNSFPKTKEEDFQE